MVIASGQPMTDGAPLLGLARVSDQDTANVDVVAPGMQIVKTAAPDAAYHGEQVIYLYAVSNTGDVPLRDVQVQDDTCVLVLEDQANDPNSNGLLDLDETWLFRCAMTLTEDTTNVAVATGQPAGPGGAALPGILPVEDTDTADVNIINPAIEVIKTASAAHANPGDTIVYTATVTNVGDDPLTDVIVADDHCGLMAYVSGDGGDAVLEPLESWVFECQAVLTGDRMNMVTVLADDSLGNAWEDTDSAFVDVLQTGIDLRKAVDREIVYVGDEVIYTIEVENTGRDPLFEVNVSDDRCSPLSGPSGDTATPGVLDAGEVWTYTCMATLQSDTMNEATVTAQDALAQPVSDSDVAAVNVIAPAIEVLKSVDREVVLSGEEVVYSYEVHNLGDDPLSEVVVSDDTCGPVLAYQGGDLNANAKLDRGEVWRYTCGMAIDVDTTNMVTAEGRDSLGKAVTDGDSAYVEVVAPSMQVVKTASATVVLPGSLVTYTYAVSNTGDTPLRDVTIADDTCLAMGAPSADANGRLDPGETWTYHCTMSLPSDTVNTVVVGGQPTDELGLPLDGIEPVGAQDAATVDVIHPGIEVIKTVDQPIAYVGDEVIYRYEVHNTGDVTLRNVTVVDDICAPVLLEQGGDANDNGWLDVDEVWVYLCYQELGQDTTNTATASGLPVDGAGAAFPGIARVEDQDTAEVNVISPALEVVKTASETVVNPGDSVTYTILVRNVGDDPLNDLILVDNRCAPLLPVVMDDELGVGEAWTFTCTMALNQDTTNTVIGSMRDSLGNVVIDTDTEFVDVLETGLVLRKSVDQPVIYAGDTVTYTIEVENTGYEPLTDVAVQDDTCSPLVKQGGDTTNVGVLDPGEVWVYTCSMALDEDTPNTASASALDGLGQTLRDSDLAEVNVINPALDVTKTVAPSIALAGTKVVYTIQVRNTGDDPVRNPQVTDPWCAPIGLVSGDLNANGVLDVGEVWTYLCCATAATEDTLNTATAEGDDTLGNPVRDSDDALLNVVAPSIDVIKTVDQPFILSGETVLYTYEVRNTGDVPLKTIQINDNTCGPISPRLSGDTNSNELLDGGEVWVYTCSDTLANDTTNRVTVGGQPSDEFGTTLPGIGTVTDTDDEVVEVVAPEIEVVKTVDQEIVYLGGRVTYTYEVYNRGDVPLADLDLSDDACDPVLLLPASDEGRDGVLGLQEVWVYTCSTELTVDTLNTATVTAQPSDEEGEPLPGIDPVSDQDAAYVDVLSPGITISKSANKALASVGDIVTYTYVVRNTGDAPLKPVVVTDDYCTPVTLFSGDGNGQLDPFEVWEFRCEYQVTPFDPDPLVNTATVVGYDALGNTAEDTTTASVTLANGSIGDVVWDDLNGDGVQDPGEPGIGGVTVVLTYADSTEVTVVTGPDGSYVFSNLPAGSYTVSLDETTIPAGYGATTPDPVTVVLASGQDVTTADFGLRDEAPVNLAIAKTDGVETVLPGEVVTYTITVSNTGGQDLTGIVVTDSIPAEGEYVALSVSAGGAYHEFTREVIWEIATLAVGETVDVSYRYRLSEGFAIGEETLTNMVVVADDGRHGPEETVEDNDATDIDDIDAEPTLTAAKSDAPFGYCCGGDAVACGDLVVYTVVVGNDGPQDAANVVFTDTAPQYTTLVGLVTTTKGLVTAGNSGGDTVTVAIGNLLIGETATITFVVAVDDILPAGVDYIENQGEATTSNGEPVLTDDPDTDDPNDPTQTPVDAAPDLAVTKTDGETEVEPGDVVTYTITVTNGGDQGATGVIGDRDDPGQHELCGGQRLGRRRVRRCDQDHHLGRSPVRWRWATW